MIGFHRCAVGRFVALLYPLLLASAQDDTRVTLGGTYSKMAPEQKALLGRWAREVQKITGHKPDSEQSYNQLPLSSRTTFEAVTHALIHSKLTEPSGKPIGRANRPC